MQHRKRINWRPPPVAIVLSSLCVARGVAFRPAATQLSLVPGEQKNKNKKIPPTVDEATSQSSTVINTMLVLGSGNETGNSVLGPHYDVVCIQPRSRAPYPVSGKCKLHAVSWKRG